MNHDRSGRALGAAGILLASVALAGSPAPKAPVHMRLVFDTSVSRPDPKSPADPAPAPEAKAPPQADPAGVVDTIPEEGGAKGEAPQPGEAAKGRGMWRGGAGSIDPRMAAAVSIPSEDSATVATVVFHVELTLLDGVERRRLTGEATRRAPEQPDAFDALAARGSPCVVVLAEIRNDAMEPLSFNPQNIMLVTDRPDIVAPLDDTRAWERLREAGLPADTMLPDLQKVIYDTAMTLRPGESISRLLAWPLPRAGFRRARIDFSFFAIGPASYSFSVPMRAVPVEPSPPAAAPGTGAPGL